MLIRFVDNVWEDQKKINNQTHKKGEKTVKLQKGNIKILLMLHIPDCKKRSIPYYILFDKNVFMYLYHNIQPTTIQTLQYM